MIIYHPFCPIQPTLVLFSLIWSYLVHIDSIYLLCPLQFYSVNIGHISPLCPLQSYSGHLVYFSPIWSILSTLVLSVDIGPIQPTLFLFDPTRSIMSTLVLICPFVLISLTTTTTTTTKKNPHIGGVWFVYLNNHFQFLNNISCISTHFFTHTYFHKYF